MRSRWVTGLISAVCGGLLLSGARAQSLNVDFDVAAGAGAGTPLITFAGAAGTGGFWNSIPATGAAATYNILAANGSMPVTLTRSYSGTGVGAVAVNNPNTSGDHEKLFDDVEQLNSPVVGEVRYSFSGLIAGTYEVYTYAIAPGNSAFRTDVTVGVETQRVGGVMPVNAFVEGVTHSRHVAFVLNDGTLEVRARTGLTFGSVNGIQLKLIRQGRLYVRPGAPAGGNGLSWATAFRDLQEALDLVPTLGTADRSVWVAAETYKPSRRLNAADPRSSVYVLNDTVSVYGGFAGTESRFEQRGNPFARPTIFSGDLGAVGDITDNAYNVFRVVPIAAGANASVELDGVTIRDANNTLNSCTAGCFQSYGGGIVDLSENDHLTLFNCVVRNNTVGSAPGGGTAGFGGGVFSNSTPYFQNTIFLNNSSRFAGAVYVASTDTSLVSGFVNCSFVGNTAYLSGGALTIRGGGSYVHNSIFTGNIAGDVPPVQGGSAIVISTSDVDIVNCTFTGNGGDPNARVITVNPFSEPIGTIQMANSIVWGNSTSFVYSSGSVSVVYSDIQDGYPGFRNISLDPLFLDANGADNIFGTLDDLALLRPNSPCIDRCFESRLRRDNTDMDGDGEVFEKLPLDLFGRPRQMDDAGRANVSTDVFLDMGCYEFQGTSCPADFDDGSGRGLPDGGVTIEDLLYYVELFESGNVRADVDDGSGTGTPDGGVTIDDLLFLLLHFDLGC